jgi:DNA primase
MKNEELVNVYTESVEDYAYSYEHGNGMRKILRPNAEKSKKWTSNIPRHIFSGWNQLEQQSKQLIITKGLKDCMVFKLFEVNAISPQSEMMFLNENQFELLSLRFDEIIINYDNDETGISNMKKFSEKFGIRSFLIPDGIKDISDYISIKGYDQTKQLITKIKNYLL